MHTTFTYAIFSILLLLASSSKATCQYYFYNEDYYEPVITWQTGIFTGAMNCLTDIGGNKGKGKLFIRDLNLQNTRPCAGIFVGATYKNLLGTRLELAFGQVMANDNVLKNDHSAGRWRYNRNLNFRSDIREITLIISFYPLALFSYDGRGQPALSPYFFAGAGSFNFSPETFYNNTWINTAELHTEGQGFEEYPARKPYHLAQWNLPMGAGVTIDLLPVMTLSLELMYRKLWTDYIDDVSKTYIDPRLFIQHFPAAKAGLAMRLADNRLRNDPTVTTQPGDIRGNDKNNDTYFSASIKIAFTLGRQKRW